MELVDADIYLFCDQDDIWQPGKIDATVDSLVPQASMPALAFTDYLVFEDARPGMLLDPLPRAATRALTEAVEDSAIYAFLPGGASAQTQGFTKALRELFLNHREIAKAAAAMHDWWMFDIAAACGGVTRLENAPKVLYRKHQDSFCATLFQISKSRPMMFWHRNQLLRRLIARHAKGLLLASTTLPQSARLGAMLGYAQVAAAIDERQSLLSATRLLRLGVKSMASPLSMLLACLLTTASGGSVEEDATTTGLLPGGPRQLSGSA
jgi:hypothetical protein